MKRQKKGFTITELVIVIAVIAVLAAVLIPTFVSLVRKANESNDIQLVHNLNTALAIDGGEHKTMQDALNAALEAGYDVDKINASASGNEILWDSANDKFCYLKDGNVEYIPETELKVENPADVAYWQICDSMPDEQKYSIYAGTDWKESTVGTETNPLKVGFDAGKNNITSIIYLRTADETVQEVVFRTNSKAATLTVTDTTDSAIKQYGECGIINGNVGAMSLHIFGKVNFVKAEQGHFVFERGCDVDTVYAIGNVKLDQENDSTIDKTLRTESAVVSGTLSGETIVTTKTESVLKDEVASEAVSASFIRENSSNDYAARIGSTGYSGLPEAFTGAQNGSTIFLLKDCDFPIGEDYYITSKTITLDMVGHKVTLGGNYPGRIFLSNQSNLTVRGNGTFDYIDSNIYKGYIFVVDGNSTLTIKNGTYYAYGTVAQAGSSEKGTVIIEDGEFYCDAGSYNSQSWLLNKKDNTDSTIEVKGGIFHNFDPSNSQTESTDDNFCAAGYVSINIGPGTFKVVKGSNQR